MRRKRPRTPGITFESLESRIALSVSNDTSPLDALSDLVPPPAVAYHTKAVAAAPAVFSSSASLARTAERITIQGTGFNAKPAHNTVIFSGGVTGKVVSASHTQLVVEFKQKPVGVGTLSAVVTTKGQSSRDPVVVATVVKPPQVTADVASLSRSAATLTIQGNGFDPSNLTNRVSIVGSATGRVIAATATTLTVAVTNLPPAATTLKAVVKSFGGKSGEAVAVATIVRRATVTRSTRPIHRSDTTLRIEGHGFDPVAANNKVTFNRGAVGYVTSATQNMLVVQLTTPPTAGRLKATVTSFGGTNAAPVQVATVQESPMVTASTSSVANSAPTIRITGAGFDPSALGNTVAFNLGAAGTVTEATGTSLTVTYSTLPTSLGNLMAVVTSYGVTSGGAVQVATVVAAPTVTAHATQLANNAPSISISGAGFNPTASGNSVAFNLGAVGTVTAATSTSLTVAFSTLPTSLGSLTAVVTSYGNPSLAPVQVATVVAAPTVTESNVLLADNAPTLTIAGTGFDALTPSANTVAFTLGAVGTVTAATSTSLTVTFTTLPNNGDMAYNAQGEALTAVVTANGGTSGAAVEVAKVMPAPIVTESTAAIALAATVLTISGTGFSTTGNNSVVLTLTDDAGVATIVPATVTANSGAVQLTVALPSSGLPAAGTLTAVVTSNGGTSGAAVQVATVSAGLTAPTVTPATTPISTSPTTLTITGTGFSTMPSANVVTLNLPLYNDDGFAPSGEVTSATATSLTYTFYEGDYFASDAVGDTLTAVVTTNGVSSGSPVAVATITTPPTVAQSTAYLAANCPTVTIYGTGFDASSPGNNVVTFSTGAGTVTAATNTSLTVTFTTQPTAIPDEPQALMATVTSYGVSSGAAVMVANVVEPSTVSASSMDLANTVTSITIFGTFYTATPSSPTTVIFNLGAEGTVTSQTAESLTVTFTTLPTSLGNLMATVTSNGGSCGDPVQVATVVLPPTVDQASTAVYLTNGATLIMPGAYYDLNAADYDVTFSNGAAGTVTNVTSSTLTVSFTTLPSTLGPMSATVAVDGTSVTQSQVAIVFPSLQNSTISCNPSSISWDSKPSTITVTVVPYDENGNLITSGASLITNYVTFNVTTSIAINGSNGSQGAVTWDSSSNCWTMPFSPNWTNVGNDGAKINIVFYGFYDGGPLSNYCWCACPSGGCFHGDSRVLMADGSRKAIRDVGPGELVWTPEGDAKVAALVTCNTSAESQPMTRIDGLMITPWHPILVDSEWRFPADVSSYEQCRVQTVYNLVLDNGHVIDAEGTLACTLGHGIAGPVIGHDFFGTHRVIDDLRKVKGWHEGRPTFTELVAIKDPLTNMVIGWRDACDEQPDRRHVRQQRPALQHA